MIMPLLVNWLFLVGTSSLCFLEQVFDDDNKLTSSFHGHFRFSSCGRCTCFSGVCRFVVVAFGLQIKRYPIQVKS